MLDKLTKEKVGVVGVNVQELLPIFDKLETLSGESGINQRPVQELVNQV